MFCKHGNLARQCLTCEQVEEIAGLKSIMVELAEDVIILKAAFFVFANHKSLCSHRVRSKIETADSCECGFNTARQYFDKVVDRVKNE